MTGSFLNNDIYESMSTRRCNLTGSSLLCSLFLLVPIDSSCEVSLSSNREMDACSRVSLLVCN